MRIGTSYFASREAANRYYAAYGETAADVARKLAAKEIHVGQPPLKAGERATLDASEGRYFIETEEHP